LDYHAKKLPLSDTNRYPDHEKQQSTSEQAKADQKPAAHPWTKTGWNDISVANIAWQDTN
jgi:hypothetical protein